MADIAGSTLNVLRLSLSVSLSHGRASRQSLNVAFAGLTYYEQNSLT